MFTKRWPFLVIALVMVLSLLLGCTATTQLKVQQSGPQLNEPLQSQGEGWVDSLWGLIDYWEGEVMLQDLVGSERDYYIDQATDLIYGVPEIIDVIETEIVELDLVSVQPIYALTPDGGVAIVPIVAVPQAQDSKASVVVVIPEDGTEPLVMGCITNIAVYKQGSIVVHPAFLIRAWWWIGGRIIWWNYWWYDSHNHPNWYYSWWYWYYRYFEYYGYYWYGWYTWYYSWWYWHYWWYWSTWWAF